jgi:hypothetical protein
MARVIINGTNDGLSGSTPLRLGRLLPWLLFAAVGFFGWRWLTRERVEATPADRAAVTVSTPASVGWRGTWLEQKGPGIIRFDANGGVFSADGVTLHSFRPVLLGDQATFRVYVKGLPWVLCLTKSGDVARLSGIRDGESGRMPLVIAGGGTAAEREAAQVRRRAEIRGMLMPTEMGHYAKTDAAATAGQPTLPKSGEDRGEEP